MLSWLLKRYVLSKNIAVLGCGWLGLPLAQHFVKQGYSVNGSTTTKSKISILKEHQIIPFLIDLNSGVEEITIVSFLKNIDVLIINIPPRMKTKSVNAYEEKMRQLHLAIKKTAVKKILFVSSTSVYGEIDGEVTEETIPKPSTNSGKELLKAENIFRNDTDLQTTILRFGGLVGPERHPVFYLSKKEEVQNGNFPINLIHLNDCISIIHFIIKKEYWGEVFNAVYPYHPTKSDFYTKKAHENNLKMPKFINNSSAKGKKIASNSLIFVKNYEFSTPI